MSRTYRTLYRLGITPWRSERVPAPLADIVTTPVPGRAVDIGCGTGENTRYLAERGWSVTGIDIVAAAIETARRVDTDCRVRWLVADITDPATVDPENALAARADLLLDNGCLHGLPLDRRRRWAATVSALAAPGATLLVRAAPVGQRLVGPRGAAPDELADLLGANWRPAGQSIPPWYGYTLSE